MSYQSQREKVKLYFNEKIIPTLKEDFWKELDYYKIIGLLQAETGASASMVDDVIKSLIQAGQLEEIRSLKLSELKIEMLKKERQDKIQEELKKAGLVKEKFNEFFNNKGVTNGKSPDNLS